MARVILAISGGIAAYKSVTLLRELQRQNHEVRVVVTESALQFVGRATLEGLLGRAVDFSMWGTGGEPHIELARWGQVLVVAPTTANRLALFAAGRADDLLSALYLAWTGPTLLVPAMHTNMWRHPATVANVKTLSYWSSERPVEWVGPVNGLLASGEVGDGRMSEPEEILARLGNVLRRSQALAGRHIVVSAGPTYEAVDTVRFLGNRSSGKMGIAIAAEARARGALVTLVHGPIQTKVPDGMHVIRVTSALEMQAALNDVINRESTSKVDVLIMAAAVADKRPAKPSKVKLKKTAQGTGQLMNSIELVDNPDILAGIGAARVGASPVLIGFAVESDDLVAEARRKLRTKKVDAVVANADHIAFEGDTNEAFWVTVSGHEALGHQSKFGIASQILDRVADMLEAKSA